MQRKIPVIGNYILIRQPAQQAPSESSNSNEQILIKENDSDSLSEDSISVEENEQELKSHSTLSAKIVNHDFKNESPKPNIISQVKMSFNINNILAKAPRPAFSQSTSAADTDQ